MTGRRSLPPARVQGWNNENVNQPRGPSTLAIVRDSVVETVDVHQREVAEHAVERDTVPPASGCRVTDDVVDARVARCLRTFGVGR